MSFDFFACAGGIAAAGLLFALPAQAQNIVVNGGFEAGTLAGWTAGGETAFIGVAPDIGHSGTWAAYAGPDPTGSLSQTLVTEPGTSYVVSFWLRLDDSAMPNSFAWSWNNVAQGQALADVSAFDYTRYSATVAAASVASTLSFDFGNPQSFWLIDDISVAVVPEPAAAALWLGGLLAMGLLAPGLKRRRAASAAAAAR